MKQCLIDNGKPIEATNEWFEKDENSVPPTYILQPISSKLHHFHKSDDPELQREQRNLWWKTYEEFQENFRFASKECFASGTMSQDSAEKFTISGKFSFLLLLFLIFSDLSFHFISLILISFFFFFFSFSSNT